jgi:hypothetical protein
MGVCFCQLAEGVFGHVGLVKGMSYKNWQQLTVVVSGTVAPLHVQQGTFAGVGCVRRITTRQRQSCTVMWGLC